MGLSLIRLSEQMTSAAKTHSPDFNDDRALVAAARRDPRAFGALYDRYVNRIYQFAYVRLGNRAAAEDATSQIFLKALQALPQFRDGLFVAWLFRIAHNVVADAVRRAPKTAPLDMMAEQSDPDNSPEDMAILATERAAFYRALNELPDEQRTVLEMTLSGFKGEEIAQILGKTHASVKMLRWRGVEAIKAQVKREGYLETQSTFPDEVGL